jgi:dienelactone hydrolase
MEDAFAFVDSLAESVGVVGSSSGAGLALGALARCPAASAGAVYEPGVSEVIDEQEAASLQGAVAAMAQLAEAGRPREAARRFVSVVANDEELAVALTSGRWTDAARRSACGALAARRPGIRDPCG